MPLNDPLQAASDERRRHEENRGRQASVFADYTTTGQGSVVFEEPVEFGLIFVQEPFMSFGCRVDIEDVEDLLDGEVALPQVTGYVVDWDTDARGNYVGAWLAASVVFPAEIPVDAELQIRIQFTFTAVAIKKIEMGDQD